MPKYLISKGLTTLATLVYIILDPTAYRNTKQRLRSEALARIRRSLAGDAEPLAGGAS